MADRLVVLVHIVSRAAVLTRVLGRLQHTLEICQMTDDTLRYSLCRYCRLLSLLVA